MRKSKGVAVINSTVFVLAAVICYAFFTTQAFCQQLLNINFTADKNSGYVIKTGPAAIGFATNDFWNVYSRDVDNEWDWRSAGTVTNLIWADGAASGVNVSVTNAAGCWGNGVSDPMYNVYLYPASGNITVTLSGLPVGHYAFYLYGHGAANNQNSLFELKSGAYNYGTLGTTTDSTWNSPVWVPGRQFVIYPFVVVEANRSVDITVRPGQYGLPFINGMQIELLSDGITSSWRQQYFGSEALTERSSAIADPDGDGASNYQEFLAGTDPLDPKSVKPQVSLLTITPTTERFTNSVTVTLATTVLNGVIRYTQDGTAPTVFSPAYTNAFRLFESTPVKARVFVNGYPVSETASAQFSRFDDLLHFINVNFTADKNSGYVVKTGPAAVGFTNDFWNVYSRDLDTQYNWRSAGTVTNLIWADGAASRVSVSVTNAAGYWANGVPDPMYNSYLYPSSGNITATLTGLPVGHYAFYLYGHGAANNQNSLFELRSGTNNYGSLGTTIDSSWNSAVWAPGRQYVVYPFVVVETNRSVGITVKPGKYSVPFINGMQIVLLNDSILSVDGIPLSWRQLFFGSAVINERSSAIADPDGDGASNYQEYLAGTDPLDSKSVKPQVSLITITPAKEWFTNSVTVTLTTTVSNGVIHHTQDGMDPSVSSPVYTNAFRLFEASIVKARVFVNGYPVSETASARFTRFYAIDDGIPNPWREQYFGAGYQTDPRVMAAADPDGDGANNLEEYLAQTNPLDPQSVLKILSIHTVPVVTWNSVPNVIYFILRKTDINSTNWTAVATVQANSSITTFTDYTATNNKAFYWITPKP